SGNESGQRLALVQRGCSSLVSGRPARAVSLTANRLQNIQTATRVKETTTGAPDDADLGVPGVAGAQPTWVDARTWPPSWTTKRRSKRRRCTPRSIPTASS